MRRVLLTMGVLAMAALTPAVSRGDDQKIAESIIQRLQTERDAGNLAGFNINLEVDQGTVWVKGHVSQKRQHELVLDVARRVPGVKQVVDDVDLACQDEAAQTAAAAKPEAPLPTTVDDPIELPTDPIEVPADEPLELPADDRFELPVAEQSIPEIGTGVDLPESSAIPAIGPVDPIVDANPIPAVPERTRGPEIRRTQAATPHGPSDKSIGQTLVGRLGQMERLGALQGCGLDLHVEGGSIYLEGATATEEQRTAVLEMARRISGVRQVVNGIRVEAAAVQQTTAVQPTGPIATSQPVAIGQATPVAMNQGGYGAAPVPMHNGSFGGGAAGVSYDHPQLPAYAWPSYASHPNYAALQYPRQYSPSTWPYIGPFYPYPQVPLGWRKVSLQWDDGWWFLDFHTRNH